MHFLQIWIEPNETGIPPCYEQKHFKPEEKRGRLRLVASPDGRDGSVTIHQDARVYAGLFDGARERHATSCKNERGYVHVARGAHHGQRPGAAGRRCAEDRGGSIELERGEQAEVLVFDLP